MLIKIVYDNKTKFITAYGEKKDLLYVSNNGELEVESLDITMRLKRHLQIKNMILEV